MMNINHLTPVKFHTLANMAGVDLKLVRGRSKVVSV